MAQKLDERVAGTVQTTDATVTTIATYTLPDACIATFEAVVVARRPSNGDSAAFREALTVKRHGGGGATIVGGQTALMVPDADAGALTWAVTLDVNVNDMRVRVTGQAAATIEWRSITRLNLYQP